MPNAKKHPAEPKYRRVAYTTTISTAPVLKSPGARNMQKKTKSKYKAIMMQAIIKKYLRIFFKNDLQALEIAAVVQLDKGKVFHVADGACPAADGDLSLGKIGGRRENRGDFSTFHW